MDEDNKPERSDILGLLIIMALGAPVLALMQIANPFLYGWPIVGLYAAYSTVRLYLFAKRRKPPAP
jgi:hypothetical protein